MQTRILLTLNFAFVMMTAIAAGAQTTSQYDPSLEKHPDQRVQYLHKQLPDASTSPAKPATCDRAKLVDFFTLAQKRADLRAHAMKIGYEAACAEWVAQTEGRKIMVADLDKKYTPAQQAEKKPQSAHASTSEPTNGSPTAQGKDARGNIADNAPKR